MSDQLFSANMLNHGILLKADADLQQ